MTNTLMTLATTSAVDATPALPTASRLGLPAGLTDDDADRIVAAISNARTESTRNVYAGAWSRWERWCVSRGIAALPGDPAALCAHLTELAQAGRVTGTLDGACCAIRHVHRMRGVADPVDSEAVRQVRRGLRRSHGSAPRRLARSLSVAEICQILSCIDRSTPIGIRDAAIILLGSASGMRRAEIVALTLGDVETQPLGLLLQVRKSKTDQEGCGQVVGVAHGSFAVTDPVAALAAWRTVRGEVPGALFTRIWATSVSLEPLSGHVVARMLRARAEAPASTASGSLRTHCEQVTPPPQRWPACRSTGSPANPRHKDLSVLVNRYIRPLEALATTSSRDLGL